MIAPLSYRAIDFLMEIFCYLFRNYFQFILKIQTVFLLTIIVKGIGKGNISFWEKKIVKIFQEK